MKPTTQIKLPKEDIIQKVAGLVMLRGPMSRLGRRLESKLLKIDNYELRDSEVVCVRRPKQRFTVKDVRTWQQIILCFGVAVISIEFVDGRKLEFGDKFEHLLHILQKVIPEKELPWIAK